MKGSTHSCLSLFEKGMKMKSSMLLTGLVLISCFSWPAYSQAISDNESLQIGIDNSMTRGAVVSSVINGFDNMDADNDGIVSLNELEKAKTAELEAASALVNQSNYAGSLTIDQVQKSIDSGFLQIDQNADGIITIAELDTMKRNVVSVVKEMFPKRDPQEQFLRNERATKKLAAAVSSGKISQEDADSIIAARFAIRAIKDEVRAGTITKEEAKAQINSVRDSIPSKLKIKKKRRTKGKAFNKK